MTQDEYSDAFQWGLDTGAKLERERIIAILEAETELMSHHSDYYNDPFGYAIALIKENN
jgi:hypothetical protein